MLSAALCDLTACTALHTSLSRALTRPSSQGRQVLYAELQTCHSQVAGSSKAMQAWPRTASEAYRTQRKPCTPSAPILRIPHTFWQHATAVHRPRGGGQ